MESVNASATRRAISKSNRSENLSEQDRRALASLTERPMATAKQRKKADKLRKRLARH